MKKLIFTVALPVLGMFLSSCASEQPATTTTTTTTTTTQQQIPPPRPETIPPAMKRGY